MDVDAYTYVHRADWDRLAALLSRRRHWGSAEADEAVDLYQRVATHLSVIRSTSPDPELVGRLSVLVAQARTAVTGTASPAWRDALRWLTVGFPVALAASRRWWLSTAAISVAMIVVMATWVARSPDVQAGIGTPEKIRRYVEQDFAGYYSDNPAGSFAAEVLTNNARAAALCLITGVLLVPVLLVLWANIENTAIAGGLMTAHGRLDIFLGLILPHGLLELTAFFVAAGAGLRLGWSWIDPGPRRRSEALARQGRITAGMALGVALMLGVSATIEAFVTPSGLPTWARIAIGVLAELAFVAYVMIGVRIARRTGAEAIDAADVADAAGSRAPVAG